MVVTVAEDGNKRKGGMSAAESTQCIQDLISWFNRSLPDPLSTGEQEDVQPIEKASGATLDETLSEFLVLCCNGIWYGDKKGLSADQIVDVISEGEVPEGCIPFASDVDDDEYLVIDERGEIRTWDSDDGLDDRVIAECFNVYVEEYRNDLLAGKFEFVEDCGCMEKAGATAGGGSRK